MESKGTFFILIIVIALLSLTIAAMTGYLFLVQGDSKVKEEDGIVVKDIPKKSDLVTIPLYEGKRVFNLKNGSSEKADMMQVSFSLICYKQLKENKRVVVEETVLAYSNEIQEIVVKFFLNITKDDVKNVEFMEGAKLDLAKQINELLNEGKEKPEDIVYKVIFSEWLFQ